MTENGGPATARVAMVGTFDVANFGDLLFPALAAHELGRRLDDVEIDLYSYRALAAPDWPYRVRSLGDLPRAIAQYDLLLIGGGHIVRSDREIADGYRPSDPTVHHPLGIWLVPALLAGAAGVPFAFNAVGVSAALAEWAHPLIDTALMSASYIAVRDDLSAQALAEIAPNTAVRVVPDTAFGIGALIANGRATAPGMAELDGRRYVVLQPCPGLSSQRDDIVAALDAARRADMAVLELPIGPALGDKVGALDLPGQTVVAHVWPQPIVLAQLIALAEGVIGESLHAGVVAVTQGVPVLRPTRETPSKYQILNGFTGIHTLGSADPGAAFGRCAPDPQLAVIAARLAAHWDVIADLARPAGARATAPAMARLLGALPGGFEAWAQHERDHAAQLDRGAEFEVGYAAFAERTAELNAELRVARALNAELNAELRVARALNAEHEAELGSLRDRAQTLARIESGGWWQLRRRLLPLLRVASVVRRMTSS